MLPKQSWKRRLAHYLPGLKGVAHTLDFLEDENRQLHQQVWELKKPRLRLEAARAGAQEPGEDGLPLPPAQLREWVSGSEDAGWFLQSGRLAVQTLQQALSRQGLALDQFEQVLDFGCGCGRVIRHLWNNQPLHLHGTDSNPVAITWCDENLEFAEFSSNRQEPPLRYRPGAFDLVYAFSVFTHLTELQQFTWMKELRRVLKPGGLLLLSLHGDYYLRELELPQAAAYRAGELVVIRRERQGQNDCVAFHPPDYVHGSFSQGFTLLDFQPEGALGNPKQDLYLLKS